MCHRADSAPAAPKRRPATIHFACTCDRAGSRTTRSREILWPEPRAADFEQHCDAILAMAARPVRRPRLCGRVDRRSRLGLRRQQGAAVPLLPRQGSAAVRHRRPLHRQPAADRRRGRRRDACRPPTRLRRLIERFMQAYEHAQPPTTACWCRTSST
ncbi:MAG: hypothetical protein MZV49_09505 [Rhodopseudomonas palustris]|nr:hypothetical protein [Rhodopseudomonas palustris]